MIIKTTMKLSEESKEWYFGDINIDIEIDVDVDLWKAELMQKITYKIVGINDYDFRFRDIDTMTKKHIDDYIEKYDALYFLIDQELGVEHE